jgi:hypothetical protein
MLVVAVTVFIFVFSGVVVVFDVGAPAAAGQDSRL